MTRAIRYTQSKYLAAKRPWPAARLDKAVAKIGRTP